MGFRFQKRLKIVPGITLNLSKKGVSTSVGTTGARITNGHGKTRTTIGIPGSGISYTQIDTKNQSESSPTDQHHETDDNNKNLIIGIGFIAALFLVAGIVSKCAG